MTEYERLPTIVQEVLIEKRPDGVYLIDREQEKCPESERVISESNIESRLLPVPAMGLAPTENIPLLEILSGWGKAHCNLSGAYNLLSHYRK